MRVMSDTTGPGAETTQIADPRRPGGPDDRTSLLDVLPPVAVPRRSATIWAADGQEGAPSGAAIFVDHSGRRRRMLHVCGLLVALGCVGFAVLLSLTVVDGTLTAPATSLPFVGISKAPVATATARTPATSPPATRAPAWKPTARKPSTIKAPTAKATVATATPTKATHTKVRTKPTHSPGPAPTRTKPAR